MEAVKYKGENGPPPMTAKNEENNRNFPLLG